LKTCGKILSCLVFLMVIFSSTCFSTDIYVNNKYYDGKVYYKQKTIWVGGEKLLQMVSADYRFDPETKILYINGKPFYDIEYKDGIWMVPLIKITTPLSARIKYNKEADVIDFYTYQIKSVGGETQKVENSLPGTGPVRTSISLTCKTHLMTLGTGMIAADVTVKNTGEVPVKNIYVTCYFIDTRDMDKVVSENTQSIFILPPGEEKTVRCFSDVLGGGNEDGGEIPAHVMRNGIYYSTFISTKVKISTGKPYDPEDPDNLNLDIECIDK